MYQQDGPDGDSPIVILQSSVNDVYPEEGERLSIADLAQSAIQIHAETQRESLGFVVTRGEIPTGKTGYFIRPVKEKVQ